MFCDAHCHLLPRMDTGPSDVAESIAMIKAMSEAGTRQILVVAHYDPRCGKTVSSYLKQRAARQKQLNHAISLHLSRSLHMRYAAQIPLLPGISHSPHLMKLCVEGTNLLPITVYESTMKRWMIKDIAHMVQKRNITPIICHMERYALIFSDHDFKALASLPQTLFQLSAAALTDAKTMEKFEWMWETDNPRLIIGSNAHGMAHRQPVTLARQYEIERSYGKARFERLVMNTRVLLRKVFN